MFCDVNTCKWYFDDIRQQGMTVKVMVFELLASVTVSNDCV